MTHEKTRPARAGGASDALLAAAFRASPVAMSISTLDGRLLSVNDCLVRTFGFAREELMRRTTLELGIWVDPRQREDLLEVIRRDGHVCRFPALARAKSGEVLRVEVSVEHVRIDGRDLILTATEDVTERTRLQTEQDRFFELSNRMMLVVGFDGRLRRWNRALEQALGWSAEHLAGTRFDAFVHPEDLPAAAALRRLRDADVPGRADLRLRATDDGYLWTSWNVAVDRERRRLYAVGRDTTRERSDAEALRASEARLRAILESAGDAFVSLDAERLAITGWNLRAEEMFGWTADEARGRSALEMLRLERPDVSGARFEARAASRSRVESLARHRDGREFPVEVSLSVTSVHGRRTLNAFIADVSERKRTEALLTGENSILGMVARGVALPELLRRLALFVEAQTPGMLCSILLLEGDRLRHASAPSLPDHYCRAIDGLRIGPDAGSCGTAAWTGKTVIAEDVETDPRWQLYRGMARAAGLRACWSTPLLSEQGGVLGTFAIYFREPRRRPDAWVVELIALASRVASVAVARHRLDQELRTSREELSRLATHLQRVQEEERTRIAREIHDELGQALTGLKLDTAWLETRLRPRAPELALRAGEMLSQIDTSIRSLRRIATDLRPGVLDDLGLVAAVEWLLRDLQAKSGVRCSLDCGFDTLDLSGEAASHVFRLIQEALTNVVRHAGAGEVVVSIARENATLAVVVRDDGRGLTDEQRLAAGSIGLIGMRERARLLGGEIAIEGEPGRGTRVRLSCPLP